MSRPEEWDNSLRSGHGQLVENSQTLPAQVQHRDKKYGNIHPDGFLGYVQGVGQRPQDSQPVTYSTTSDFGVGAFLMAASEVARLTT